MLNIDRNNRNFHNTETIKNKRKWKKIPDIFNLIYHMKKWKNY